MNHETLPPQGPADVNVRGLLDRLQARADAAVVVVAGGRAAP